MDWKQHDSFRNELVAKQPVMQLKNMEFQIPNDKSDLM